MGVNIVAMRFSGIFKSLEAKEIDPKELECLCRLSHEVNGPTAVYAGVNADNLPTVAATGVQMVGIASAVDDLLYLALNSAVEPYIQR
jgi:thiamine monophosphate synthase